jgi:hypothetical protein
VRALSVMRLCALVTAGALFAAITYVAIHARLYPEVNAVDGPEGAIVLGALASCTALAIVAFLTKAQNGVQETLRSKESEM